jgi:hypothetical protein
MFGTKTVIWLIIALMFFVLAFYSWKAFKPTEIRIREMNKAHNGGADISVNGISLLESPILLCKSIKAVSYIGMVATILSAIAAVLSIYLIK